MALRHYTPMINLREDWRGNLWQGRFASSPMDQSYLPATARYVDMDAVRAGMASHPGEYPWSSARAHLTGQGTGLVQGPPWLALASDWQALLKTRDSCCDEAIRLHQRTGCLLGSDEIIQTLSVLTLRDLRKRRPGPKCTSNQLLSPEEKREENEAIC